MSNQNEPATPFKIIRVELEKGTSTDEMVEKFKEVWEFTGLTKGFYLPMVKDIYDQRLWDELTLRDAIGGHYLKDEAKSMCSLAELIAKIVALVKRKIVNIYTFEGPDGTAIVKYNLTSTEAIFVMALYMKFIEDSGHNLAPNEMDEFLLKIEQKIDLEKKYDNSYIN